MDFEIGDLIIGIEVYDGENIVGLTGTIIGLPKNNDDIWPIEFNTELDAGHTCAGRGREGHCWWVHIDYFNLIENQVVITSSGNPIIDRSRKLWSKSKFGKKQQNLVKGSTA